MSPSTLFGPRCWPICPPQAPGCWRTCNPALLPFSRESSTVSQTPDSTKVQAAMQWASNPLRARGSLASVRCPAQRTTSRRQRQHVLPRRCLTPSTRLGPRCWPICPPPAPGCRRTCNQALLPSSREPPSVSQKPDSSLVQIHTQGAGNPFACQRKSCICSVPCSVNNKPSTKAARVVIL